MLKPVIITEPLRVEYTAESVDNKVTSLALADHVTYPTSAAVVAAVTSGGGFGGVLVGITSFTGSTSVDLPSVATVALAPGSSIPYFIRMNGQFVAVYLESGTADVGQPLGEVNPLDYHATTNNKHWVRGL